MQTLTRSCAWRAGAAILLATLMAGCAHPGPKTAPLDPQQVRSYEASGYPANGPFATGTARQLWTVQGQTVELLWTLPSRDGPHPLVVYLPGLGEDAQAGIHWRETWSRAGYAVLSVQALSADARARQAGAPPPPPSDDAPTKEPNNRAHAPHADSPHPQTRDDRFNPLAKERFAGEAMQQRLQVLDAVLREAADRASQGDPLLRQVDLTRVAIAGFDLGAYTSMSWAGERVSGVQRPAGGLQPRAYLALSPYASFADSGFDTRYQGIRAPVLSITADGDTDPSGLVSGSYLRVAPFNGMPAGDKYLLVLLDGNHALLSGNDLNQAGPGDDGDAPSRADSAPGERGDRSTGKRSGPRGGGGGSGGPGGGGRGMPDGMSSGSRIDASPTAQALRQVAAESVSLAFLDAYLRDDAIAREWLARDAPRWLARNAELQVK
jgi:uncharacterized membrane protein YgcG